MKRPFTFATDYKETVDVTKISFSRICTAIKPEISLLIEGEWVDVDFETKEEAEKDYKRLKDIIDRCNIGIR